MHFQKGCTPAKRNSLNKVRTKKERAQLRRMHCIENLFCRLDKFKRLHVRRDKSIASFEAMHQLAFCLLVINKMDMLDCD
jgi:transposase